MDTEQVEAILAQMFMQAKMQFGKAVKGYWFYADEGCPGCGSEVDALKYEGERAISLNGYMYRPRGILIGYFLCGRCANKIIAASKRNPGKQIPLHDEIETNLAKAYRAHLH